MPWSSFSECWALSQLFHSPLSLSSRGFLVLLQGKININLANKTKERSVMCCPLVAAFGNNSGKTAAGHLTCTKTEGCRKIHRPQPMSSVGWGEDSEQGQWSHGRSQKIRFTHIVFKNIIWKAFNIVNCYRSVNQKSTRRYQLITVRTAFVKKP